MPIFFGLTAWCKSSARGFKWRLDLDRPTLGAEHEENEMPTFSPSFGEESLLLTGRISSRHRFAQPRNQSK